ncbi:hypothetical protein BB561_002734 [Smittium simulii]|uniref:Uncharacterized protein n=1 Tax=Smittium simulii TaxID=133385 RepID=A0A2T9YPE2_9FUNG|nr:hypothetical protein BB561_002734 [Smittium simulii]
MRLGFTLFAISALAATAMSTSPDLATLARRAARTYNVDLMKTMFATPEWNNLFTNKSPADRKSAEDASVLAAQTADSSAAALGDEEAKKQAQDSYDLIKSKISSIKAN